MSDPQASLSRVLIGLFKGVVYRDDHLATWEDLVELQARIRDYIAVLGLELVLDPAEGYAYLRQKPTADDEPAPPRLVSRRPLGYSVSLLLVLLRKKLLEHDASGGDPRLVLSRAEIVELLRVFLRETANEARLVDRITTDLNKVVELGFLRRLRGQDDQFEVARILQSFVDGQWLAELDRRLADYRDHAADEQG